MSPEIQQFMARLHPYFTLLPILTGLVLGSLSSAVNAQPVIPNFWDTQERFIKPNIKSLPRLRFVTTTDFPPFSFIDRSKRLTGFHVDLARAICEELEVLPVCQIQALPFNELEQELSGGRADAIMAGLAITPIARSKFNFSRPYFRLPARFVAQEKEGYKEPLIVALAGKSVAIVDRTAHAAYARAHFGDMHLRLFNTRREALVSLQKGEVEAMFGDGLQLSFWLQNLLANAKPGEAACCEFVGGAYLSDAWFGTGLSIALASGNGELEDAINYALRSINDKGIFAELYLRYFPISLF